MTDNAAKPAPKATQKAGRTIQDLVLEATGRLRRAGFEDARLEAELLLAGVLGMRRSEIRLNHSGLVEPVHTDALARAIDRRLRHEPVQYILGVAPFRDLTLAVDRRVLVPRPETELLVEQVLAWTASTGRRGDVLEVGTGSGAIALSLASEGAFSRIVATDISEDALAVAATNAQRLGLVEAVEFRHGPLFEPVRPGERFTAIVSNPPYVAESERAALPAEVREWEPAGALFAGEAGTDVLFALVDGGSARLELGGLLALELAPAQVEAVAARAQRHGYGRVRVVHDLADRERIVLAERGEAEPNDNGLRTT